MFISRHPLTQQQYRRLTALIDGNKRTSFQVLSIVLDLNGIQVVWDVEAVGQNIIQFSQSLLDEEGFTVWLMSNTKAA
jgi:prophage maintenance system killer protein